MILIDIFKTSSKAERIEGKLEIDSTYRYWRYHTLLNIYIGYAGFYFARKSINYVMPELMTDFGLDMTDVGLLGTLFYITYGLSKFFSGCISDNANPRYFMGIGLIVTGIINIFCGLSNSFALFAVLWMLNAVFQGWGWPSCVKLLTTWYSRSERGLWWSIWSTAHNAANIFLSILVSFIALNYGWREGMFVPGIMAVLIGLLLCWRLRDKPITMGLPTVGKWRNDQVELVQERHAENLSYREAIRQYVFYNKYIWLLVLSYVLVYVVRIAIEYWGNLYLIERYGYDLVSANSVIVIFEIGGIAGALIAGRWSDVLFNGNRILMTLLFSIGIFFAVTALWLMPAGSYFLQAGCFFSLGFFVFGPQMLIGMTAAECSHKKVPGASTGFIGFFAYVGAAMASYPLGIVIEKFHWNGFFIVIAIASALIGLVLLPFLKGQQLP